MHDRQPPVAPWLSLGRGCVTLRLVARPGAPRTGILRADPRGLVVGLKAAPERGKANAELVAVVARLAGVTRSAVQLVTGATARTKSVRIMTADPAAMAEKLAGLV